MTANKPMTGEQLDELMTVAVNFQRDSEKAGERSCANFAYAVQVAVLELRKVRADVVALAAENGQMLRLLTDVSENHGEFVNEEDDYLYASVPLDFVSEVNMYVSRDVNAENPFKNTDAFLAEVRAQGVEMFAAFCGEENSVFVEAKAYYRSLPDAADEFAAKLRQGAAS